MSDKITLQPLTMVIPTGESIYAPSRLRQKKVIEYGEFLEKYADWSHQILVSFEPDCTSNPQSTTGYIGDCWYILAKDQ